jgi:hypothetical protein
MSMNCYLLALGPTDLAAIKRKPGSAAAMVEAATLAGIGAMYGNLGKNFPDIDQIEGAPPPSAQDRKAWDAFKRDMLAQIAGLRRAAAGKGEVDPSRVLDLHKSWHVLHYLFTGQAEDAMPPGNALLGGQELGEDTGYGPPRFHEPAAIAAFARFLAPLTVEELQGRLDLPRMAALGVYCCDDPDDEGSIEELNDDIQHYFPQLQTFVGAAAKKGQGMLVWLS